MLNLDRWVRKAVLPPRAERIHVSGADTVKPAIERDQFGNALGGVRTAYVTVPIASYNGSGHCGSTAHEERFSWEQLDKVYGSYRNFARKFAAAVDVDVQNHWVPEAYAARMKAGQIAMPTLEGKRPGKPSASDTN